MRRRHRRSQESAKFLERVENWASKLHVEPEAVYLQRMTTKWASCSPAGRICFSSDLMAESDRFRDAVIVHELLHLRIPNHGKLFKSLMNAFVPGWECVAKGRVARMCRSR
jgi:predicted metal-dependent hydrolase